MLRRPFRRITFCSFLFFILLISEFCARPAHARTPPQVPPRSPAKILVLYTYGDGLPGYLKADAAFWPVIIAGGLSPNDVFIEYLDLQRNPGAEYRRRVADLFRYKYAGQQIGVIVAAHFGALEFLLEEGKGLFPDVPVFSYLIVRPELIEKKNTGRRILQRPQNLDVGGTLEIASKMFPQTRKVVFVTGTAEARLEYEAKRAFEPWRDKLEFEYTSDRSIEEMLQFVASLPPRSIVIYCNVFSDRTGRTFTPLEVGKRVAKAANAPVFCLWDTLIGGGPIGGSLLSFEAEGAYAANIALDILNGKILLTKPVTTLPSGKKLMFDWRQLKRWNLSVSALPEGSIVINREVTFWDFKYYILGVLAAGAVQLLLIAGLLAHRRRRAKAEEILRERLRFERLHSDISARLLNIAPDEIDREVEGTLKGIVDFFRVSHSVLIKGFPEEHRAGITHAAHADDVPPTPLGGNLYDPFPWTSNRMAQGETLLVTTLDGLPAEAAADRETYRNLGVRSFLILPIIIKGSPAYAISISSRREERVWPEDYLPRLELLGEILVNALERKEAEAAAREKTEELDQFFNVSLDVLCIAKEGYCLRVNPAAETILGYTREELMAARLIDFIHPDDLDRTLQLGPILSSEQKVFSFANRFRRKDGTYRWLEWSAVQVGKIIYAAARDVTERKRVEEELVQHSRNIEFLSKAAMGLVELPARENIYVFIGKRLRQLIDEAIYVSVNSIDRETRRIQVRALLADDRDMQAAARALGIDPMRMSLRLSDEAWNGLLSGRLVRVPGGIHELLFGTLSKAACDELEKGVGTGDIFTIGINRKNQLYGSATIIMRKGALLINGDIIETFIHQAGIALQRVRAEGELAESEERFRTLVEESPVAIGISRGGVILYVNRKFLEIFGYQGIEELRGRPVFDQWAPQCREGLAELGQEMPAPFGFEGTGLRRDGSQFFLRADVTSLQLADGPALVTFLTDITARKRAEESLRNREKEAQRTAREALAMAEIGRILSSTLTIDEVYESFAAVAKEIIPFDRIVINMIGRENGTVRNLYIAGDAVEDREVEKIYPLEGSGNAEMLRTNSTFLLQAEDFEDYEDYKDRYPMLVSTLQTGFRSILNVPLFSGGKIIGGLLLRSFKPHAYSDEHVRLAERVGNQIAGAVANAQLFSKQKHAERALRESEDRFRQVAENVGDFIWEIDANGLYRYTSPSVERILGYTPGELIGKKHFYDLFAPDVREELKAAAFKVFAARGSFRAFPNPNLSKRGKVVHMETSGVPVLDGAGNLVGYRGADTDVTERKRVEGEVRRYQEDLEALVKELRKYQEHLEDMIRERTGELVMAMDRAEAANQAKSAFLANMSHELRTPLTSILGFAQLMKTDPDFPERLRPMLGVLHRSGHHLLELIDDVLEMSKIEAGKLTKKLASFDLQSFIADLLDLMRPRAEQKDLSLVLKSDPALRGHVKTDARKLRQILINLLGNALKYTQEGQIVLKVGFIPAPESAGSVAASPARLEFEVEDTGIGIAPGDLEKIFEPFVQLNAGRATNEGTGLGLTLSRVFVELLGGEITIRSEPGRGTTVGFYIEVERATGGEVQGQGEARQVFGLAPGQPAYRLLVVDDNLESRLLFRMVMEPRGFAVVEAAGGAEAVEVFHREKPDMVWMDLRMPEVDGYEAARRIREAEDETPTRNGGGPGSHTPIIALTAGIKENKDSSPLSWVFDDWVYKPFREAELFEKVEKHLRAEFVYQASPAPQEKDLGLGAGLKRGDLARLSADWLRRFVQALRRGRTPQMLDLIQELGAEYGDVEAGLRGMIQRYRFDTLIALTEEALHEK